MTTPLPVATDHATLERFAYQLFCQAAEETSRPRPSRQPLRAAALQPDRLQSSRRSPEELLATRATIPLAHRLWLAHLLWLEDILHTLDCRPADVSAVELAGLQVVARARARFLRTHQFCPHCEAANLRLTRVSGTAAQAPRCRRCHQEL